MIIVTGPQGTDDERGDVAEAAGLMGGLPSYSHAVQWAAATALVCLDGWERCPLAVADVTVAASLGLTVQQLVLT
ncbi:hypothetical protein AT728_07270 [Streptomyces silvensis]|uniref:Uncharacterized protein n=1 Tax=Streptomyces silvensis TaxID=1765722 RepID=A0A0W7X7C5_9ACTN|nr:hypothetical protein AT728_07270 [Streptomyces silvensis]